MRLFELTIAVYTPDDYVPEKFNDWVVQAFGFGAEEIGASPTTLQSVRELRYPLAEDIVARRGGKYPYNPYN